MDKNKQRIAIHKARGGFDVEVYRTSEGDINISPIPNYPKDLNAIQSAILDLPDEKHHNYMGYLSGIVGVSRNRDIFYMHNATAEQRAEAFLKTFGLWED